MTRFETIPFFVFIVFFVQHLISLTKCEDKKRIIIYVPPRVKTIHHHHHHVILMNPKKTTNHAQPNLENELDEDYQRTRYAQHSRQQQQRQYFQHKKRLSQQQQLQYQMLVANRPVYSKRRKTIRSSKVNPNVGLLVYPVAQLPIGNNWSKITVKSNAS